MSRHFRSALLAAALTAGAALDPAVAGGLTPEAMWSLTRLSDPQPTVDGARVAFVAREYDTADDSSTASLWLVAAATGEARRLTRAPVHDGSPRSLQVADVGLLRPGLAAIPPLFELATRAVRRARWNLGWAFAFNGVGLWLAASGKLTPVFAAAAMTASSAIVAWSSRRALLDDAPDTTA